MKLAVIAVYPKRPNWCKLQSTTSIKNEIGNSNFDEFAFILPKNDSDVEALKKEALYELANLNKHLQDLLDLKK